MAQRLVGAPPGYVDSEEGGFLTEAVRRRPYSVLLFDEVEKAHTDVFNLLLQVLDDGRLTDGRGRTANFSNTVVIMTSNIGSKRLLETDPKLFETAEGLEALRDVMQRRAARLPAAGVPEPHRRRRPLPAAVEEGPARDRRHPAAAPREAVTDRELKLQLTEEAKDKLVDLGYEPAFGARPLKRAILKQLQDPLAEEILRGGYPPGAIVKVELSGRRLRLREGLRRARAGPPRRRVGHRDGSAGGALRRGGARGERVGRRRSIRPSARRCAPLGVRCLRGLRRGARRAGAGRTWSSWATRSAAATRRRRRRSALRLAARVDVGRAARALPRAAAAARRRGHPRQDDDERDVRVAPVARGASSRGGSSAASPRGSGRAPRSARRACGPDRGRAPFVVEGDEYDAVYWHKQPKFLDYVGVGPDDVAIVTSVEHDHVDIYPDVRVVRGRVPRASSRALPERGPRRVRRARRPRCAPSWARHARARVVWYALEHDDTGDVTPTWLGAPARTSPRRRADVRRLRRGHVVRALRAARARAAQRAQRARRRSPRASRASART